ncbi:MAG: hypothetical protein KAU28_00725, partial [Phycisphaerae bacterium]|nr:hypothetical protein [Phycisphaerae bacterium]
MARTSYLTTLLTVLAAGALPALGGGDDFIFAVSARSNAPRPDMGQAGEVEILEGVHLEGGGGNFQST